MTISVGRCGVSQRLILVTGFSCAGHHPLLWNCWLARLCKFRFYIPWPLWRPAATWLGGDSSASQQLRLPRSPAQSGQMGTNKLSAMPAVSPPVVWQWQSGAWKEKGSLSSIPCQKDEAASMWQSFFVQSPSTWQPGQQQFFSGLLPFNCNQEGETDRSSTYFNLQLLFGFVWPITSGVSVSSSVGHNSSARVRIKEKLTMVWNYTHSLHIPSWRSSHGSCLCKGHRDACEQNQLNFVHVSWAVSAGPSVSTKKLKLWGRSCESCQLTGHSRRISGFMFLRRKFVAQHMMRVSISKMFLLDLNKITLLRPQSLFIYRDFWKATCGLTKRLRRKQNKSLEITCTVCLLSLNRELILFPWLLYPSLQLWYGWFVWLSPKDHNHIKFRNEFLLVSSAV